MAWVTVLGPNMAQVEYRLNEAAGCSLSPDMGKPIDPQTDYRLDGDAPGTRTLEWIGNGLPDVGIEPGTMMTEPQKEWARALMSGADPHTGEVLVKPKLAVDPRGKLEAAPLLAAVAAARVEYGDAAIDRRFRRGLKAKKLYETASREVFKKGSHHAVPVKDAVRIARMAKATLDDVYPADVLAHAREHAAKRIVVGNRGYDLTLDIAKSVSVLYAMADEPTAAELEKMYLQTVRETVGAVEGWAAYGMRGKHGDGQRATRMDTSGVLGWMMVHRTARPVGGNAPDPHLHAHVSLANMVKGLDGKWSTVAAGGRDLHRHAHAADAYLKARMRQITAERWGIDWKRDEITGAWEIAAIPDNVRHLFSKRSNQVAATLKNLGIDLDTATTAQSKDAAARSREAKHPPGPGGDLRADWQRQARAAGADPAQLVADAMPGPSPQQTRTPSAADIAAWVFRDGQTLNGDRRPWQYRDEHGLTSHSKVTTRADVLAAVMDARPDGLSSLQDAENLVDEVLAVPGYAVRLPDKLPEHLSNNQRYTTADIIEAEKTILDTARARYDQGAAVVDPDTVAMAKSAYEAEQGFALTAEQHQVLDRLLTAGHGVDAVIGVAGSGKTSIMSVLRAAYQAEGHTVAGATTAAVAAANLRAESGIHSATVASWLKRIDLGEGLRDVDVLVVDEAATVDDRQMATLMAHAAATGTKVVGIGDPMQLRAPGVGGAFAAIHELVDGTTLSGNRRQRDLAERHALTLWREGEREVALRTFAAAGRVHPVDTAAQAHAELLDRWDQVRTHWPDVHERIEKLLLLAGSNADVDTLNNTAQAIRREAGELGAAHHYAQAGGRNLTLHIGDQVMTRVNERRDDGPNVLNGYRGVVAGISPTGELDLQWMKPGQDGNQLVTQQISADYIINGGVDLAYALTVAKAQGLTADQVLVYGQGLDPHTLYPALSRQRGEAHLWLARELLESAEDQARLGPPRTPQEQLDRAVAAYAAALERGADDVLILAEFGEADLTVPGTDRNTPARTPATGRTRPTAAPAEPDADPNTWRGRPLGHYTDTQLTRAQAEAQRQRVVEQQRAAARAKHVAEQTAKAQAGQGPKVKALRAQRDNLAAAVSAAEQARAHQNTARAAGEAITALRAEREQNPLRLAMRGTSRAELDQKIAAQHARTLAAENGAAQARGEAVHYQRVANVPADTSAARALAELNAQWEQHAQKALETDLQTAIQPQRTAADLGAIARPDRGPSPAQIAAEQATRAQMNRQAARAEQAERQQWIQAQTQAQAERQAQQAQQQATPSAQQQAQPNRGAEPQVPEIGL